MRQNGQPFNILSNPPSSFIRRLTGGVPNSRPIHGDGYDLPIGVSSGFKAFWGFDGTTKELQHLSGLGALVADEPRGIPLMGEYPDGGGVGPFSPERWIWADGDDGSEKLAELEADSFKYFAWNGDYRHPTVLEEMDKESYDALIEEAAEFGGLKSDAWAKEFEERFGEPGRLIAWRTKKQHFRHMCDRLLIAQNCWLEPIEDNPGVVILRHGRDLHWHAPDLELSPFHGKVRGWTGPECDIEVKPWMSIAEEKAKEESERYDEDEDEGEEEEEEEERQDEGTIQFHTLRYLDFIPLAIHQHPTYLSGDGGHVPMLTNPNPGKRQSYADQIIEDYQVRDRNKLPRAWGIQENVPVYRIKFHTPRERREDGKTGRFIEEDIDDAIAAVDSGTGIEVHYWGEVQSDANTQDSEEKIFDEHALGYYWKLVDKTGWTEVGKWLFQDTDKDGKYDRRKPKGEWVPYENPVNKLFYCGPSPVQWDSSWGGKIEVDGKEIWNPDGDAFIHGNREFDDYSETVDDGLTAQDKLRIPIGAAFDLMVFVEVWTFRQYVIFDQSKPFPKPQNDEDPMYTLNEIPGSFRRLGLQVRIVKPIPPEGAGEKGGKAESR